MQALLAREPFFITREQWEELDDWYIVNVLFRPSTNEAHPENGYWPVGRMDPDDPTVGDLTFREMFYLPERVRAMKEAGMTPEDMEMKYRNWIRSLNVPLQGEFSEDLNWGAGNMP